MDEKTRQALIERSKHKNDRVEVHQVWDWKERAKEEKARIQKERYDEALKYALPVYDAYARKPGKEQ